MSKKKYLVTEEMLVNLYRNGVKDGLRQFAHWKDGKEFVGTCGTTLKSALESADEAPITLDHEGFRRVEYKPWFDGGNEDG